MDRLMRWCGIVSVLLVFSACGETDSSSNVASTSGEESGGTPLEDGASSSTKDLDGVQSEDALYTADATASDPDATLMEEDALPNASEVEETTYILSETLEISLNTPDALLVLFRNGEERVRIPRDGLILGVVENLDPELNYNPYRITEGTGTSTGRFSPDDLTWVHSLGFQSLTETEDGVLGALRMADGRESTLRLSFTDGRIQFLWEPPKEGNLSLYRKVIVLGDEEEGFYGMGGVLDDVNHRGKIRGMNFEVSNLESGYNEAHVPIPLLLGTTGWGLFVESYRPGVFEVAFDTADEVHATFGFATAPEEPLTFHLFTADHPLDLTLHYYRITGFPGAVAPWALGPWIWRDEVDGQAVVEEDLNTLRSLDLATTGYWIDRPYATDVNSFDFHPDKYPSPESMMEVAHGLGFEVALWHTPYVDPKGTLSAILYQEAEESGFFAPLLPTAFAKWGPPLDFSNPEAVDWWRLQLEPYKALGITGYKLDFGQEVITGLFGKRLPALFADGTNEMTMHRRYGKLYHEAYRPMIPEEGGFLLCRAGSYGDQVNGCIIWPGDIDATFAKSGEPGVDKDGNTYNSVGGLPAAIITGSSLGPSGYPLFASDTGGYLHASPTKECFLRWVQHTAFSPAMQVGTNANDLPWKFGPNDVLDPEIVDIYRIYARLHLRLFPYLWSALQDVQTSGRAIQRPFGLAFPEMGIHPNDVYLLGNDILVAPVVDEGATSKTLLLPPGEWIDWWTGERHLGEEEITRDAPLDTLPVFVRAGAPIPMLRETIDAYRPTNNPALVDSFATDPNPLTIRVTTGPDQSRTLYDGTLLNVQETEENTVYISRTLGSVFNEGCVVEVHGIPVDSLLVSTGSGEPIPAYEEGGMGWRIEEGVVFIHGDADLLDLSIAFGSPSEP